VLVACDYNVMTFTENTA